MTKVLQRRFPVLLVLSLAIVPSKGQAKSWIDEIDARIFGETPQLQSYNAGVELFKGGKVDEALSRFQIATAGEDRQIKAKALHNSAVIQIQKQALVPARDLLKQALAFDNGNRAIEENLAWVEEQLKKQKPEEQKQKPEEQKQKDKSQEEQKAPGEEKSAEEKDAKGQEGQKDKPGPEQKQADSKDKSGRDGSQDQKSAEQDQKKDGEAGKPGEKKDGSQDQKAAEQDEKKDGDAKDQASAEDKGKDDKKASPKDKAQLGKMGAGDPNQKTDDRYLVTPEEIKQQEAERMLRSIDDKIGRYPLTDTEATRRRGKDGKNW